MNFITKSLSRLRVQTVSSPFFKNGANVQSLRGPIKDFPADCPHQTDFYLIIFKVLLDSNPF